MRKISVVRCTYQGLGETTQLSVLVYNVMAKMSRSPTVHMHSRGEQPKKMEKLFRTGSHTEAGCRWPITVSPALFLRYS